MVLWKVAKRNRCFIRICFPVAMSGREIKNRQQCISQYLKDYSWNISLINICIEAKLKHYILYEIAINIFPEITRLLESDNCVIVGQSRNPS